jgi:hypothetical protein
MYGVQPDNITAFSKLNGGEIIQICIGSHDLQFNFTPNGNVSVWGRCELIDPNGRVRDDWQDGRRSQTFRFLELLGSIVTEITIEMPNSVKLKFDSRWYLRLIDCSDKYESFSINGFVV